ncbi:MAG: hypothetical protein EHM20_11630 [Alphaproteobacteria bacterium]|nr:MAG: hypothetical protein EHM20_11630 [Alphaproteobacteria bacterium]
MKRIFKTDSIRNIVHWKPGAELDDISLLTLYRNILKVNNKSGANIKHNLLQGNLSLVEIRKLYSNTIISEFILNEESTAFLISVILQENASPILHIGLMIIDKNPGGNVMGLLSIGNFCMAYEKLGPFHITNITSTPSSIESFDQVILNSWPGPDIGLKKPPPGYREIVRILKSDYIEKYFPDADELEIDLKRFVLSSNSEEMGFVTNFYKISRANNFKYNLFCRTWIDYDQEEDIIQVGKANWYIYWRAKIILFFIQRSLKKILIKKMHKETRTEEVNDTKQAA